MDTPEIKARIDKFNKNVTERLSNDNFKLKEGETVIYDDIDDVSDNDKLDYIETNDQNINHAVERDNNNEDY